MTSPSVLADVFTGQSTTIADSPTTAPTHDGSLDSWLGTKCTHRARCWGGLMALYRRFRDWQLEAGSEPVTVEDFARHLHEKGFEIKGGLVRSLILRAWAPRRPEPRYDPNMWRDGVDLRRPVRQSLYQGASYRQI